MRTRALAFGTLALLLLAGVPRADDEVAWFDRIDALIGKGVERLGLEPADLAVHHDFIPADAWRLSRIESCLANPRTVARDAHARFRPWVTREAGLAASLGRAFSEIGVTVEQPPGGEPPRDLYEGLAALYEGTDVQPPDRKAFQKEVAVLPRGVRSKVARLVGAMARAVALREQAFGRLSEEEWVQLRKFGSQFNTGIPPAWQVRFLGGLHARIDLRKIARAGLVVAAAVEDLLAARKRLPVKFKSFHLSWKTPAGWVELGGGGANTFEHDALLVLDFAGDDVHRHSAGGTLYTPRKVSLCLDLAGDDVYETDVGLAQGSGMYGVGMLVDAEGDDRYKSKNVSQGVGHVGVGVLWDLSGNDRYEARSMAQGAALQGVGLLRDEEGSDRYEVGFMGQGLGSTLGLGILQDLAGDDVYRAGGLVADTGRDATHFLSLAQGHGQGNRAGSLAQCSSGGIGLLADGAGDDNYEADVFGQGCAYWYALGVLLDAEGDDRYTIHNYGQGGGFHMAVGVCLDERGDDTWRGPHHAQGHALDRSVGWLVDFAGSDTYLGTSEAQGCAVKPYALGFFADVAGNDTYRGGTPGYVRIPAEGPDGPWPKAFFLDLAGTDVYETGLEAFEPALDGEPADGGVWTVNAHGVGRDL